MKIMQLASILFLTCLTLGLSGQANAQDDVFKTGNYDYCGKNIDECLASSETLKGNSLIFYDDFTGQKIDDVDGSVNFIWEVVGAGIAVADDNFGAQVLTKIDNNYLCEPTMCRRYTGSATKP
jgi:hypothetical protein